MKYERAPTTVVACRARRGISLRFEPLRAPHRGAAAAQHVIPPAPHAKQHRKQRPRHAPGQHHFSRPGLWEEPAGRIGVGKHAIVTVVTKQACGERDGKRQPGKRAEPAGAQGQSGARIQT